MKLIKLNQKVKDDFTYTPNRGITYYNEEYVPALINVSNVIAIKDYTVTTIGGIDVYVKESLDEINNLINTLDY